MVKSLTRWRFFPALTALGAVIFALFLNQAIYVDRAHQTFDNYYAFRGCQTLLSKDSSSATCRLSNGSTIKIVSFHGKWYLDGDLPNCIISSFCF